MTIVASGGLSGVVLNEVIEQGATWGRSYQLLSDATSETPLDVSSYTARMQIRPRYDSTSAEIIANLSSDPSSGISLVGSSGTITVTIPASHTASMDFKKAVYDLEAVDASGTVIRVVAGTMQLLKEVTR